MALITSLQYMQENSITTAHLFTDNKTLYNEGINKILLKKYVNASVELFWLPREFNKESDSLSKSASSVTVSDEWNVKTAIKQYPLSRRFKLFKQLAINDWQKAFIKNLENQIILNTQDAPQDSKYRKLVLNLLNKGEIEGTENLTKNKNWRMSGKQIEVILEKRKAA